MSPTPMNLAAPVKSHCAARRSMPHLPDDNLPLFQSWEQELNGVNTQKVNPLPRMKDVAQFPQPYRR